MHTQQRSLLGVLAPVALLGVLSILVENHGRAQCPCAAEAGSKTPARVAELIKLLDSKAGWQRGDAAYELGNCGEQGAPAVARLILLLSDTADSNPDRIYSDDRPSMVADDAEVALHGIGRPAVEPLIVALKTSDLEARERMICVLGVIKDPRAVKPLAAVLNDPKDPQRTAVAAALGEIASAEAVGALLAALDDAEAKVRAAAAIALGHAKATRAIEALRTRLLTDRSEDVRAAAGTALSDIGPPALDAILSALDSPNASVRAYAALLLNTYKDPRVGARLMPLLHDEGRHVRTAAIRTLSYLKHAPAVEACIALLKDPDPSVRMVAADALGDPQGLAALADRRATRPLIDALKDEDATVRGKALNSLGFQKDPAAVAPLVAVLKDGGQSVGSRRLAIDGLIRLGGPEAVRAVAAAINEDPALEVRRLAAFELGWTGSAQVIDPLLAALRHKDLEVRRAAADSLGRLAGDFGIADPRSLGPLRKLLSERSDDYLPSTVQFAIQQIEETLGKKPKK